MWEKIHTWFLIVLGAILFYGAPTWAIGLFLMSVGIMRLQLSRSINSKE